MPKTVLVDADGEVITTAEIAAGKYLLADGVSIPAGHTLSLDAFGRPDRKGMRPTEE